MLMIFNNALFGLEKLNTAPKEEGYLYHFLLYQQVVMIRPY